MTPYEIMLSESQERMLLIVKRGREAEVERIFEKWDLHAVRIGEVTADGLLRVKERGTVVADVPNRALTDEAPVYHRPMHEPAWLERSCSDSSATQLRRYARRDRRASRAAGVADRSPASTGFTGSTTTWCAPTRLRSPGCGAAVVRVKGTGPRAGDVGRRQRALLLARPAPGREAGGGGGRAQRRVRGRRCRSARPTA